MRYLHNPALLGIRGWLCLWIASAHYYFVAAYNPLNQGVVGDLTQLSLVQKLLRFDFIAVDIFFVLSGYLLYAIYHKTFANKQNHTRKDINKFNLVRLAKLYPLHIFTLALIAAMHYAGVAHPTASGNQDALMDNWPITLFINLVLMMAWSTIPAAAWNEPAWTISCMWLIYLVFPMLVAGIKYINSKYSIIIWLAIFIAIQQAVHSHFTGLSATDGAGAVMRSLLQFVSGCLVYKLIQNISLNKHMPALLFIAAIALFTTGVAYVDNYNYIPLFYTFAIIIVFCIAQPHRLFNMLFGNKLAMYLGKISYAIYILHYPYLLMINHLQLFAIDGFSVYLATICGLIICASMAYHLIEKPIVVFTKRRIYN